MNNDFINAYLDIITSGISTNIDIAPSKNTKAASTADNNSRNKWKQICNTLMMMVNNQSPQLNFSKNVISVFQKILNTEGGSSNNNGYQKYMEFILEDTNLQIDKILYNYCNLYANTQKMNVEKIINFLLTLANLDISKVYRFSYNNSTKPFEQWEEQMIYDLASLGMIRKDEKSKEKKMFVITPVLWQFCFRKIDLKTLNAKITIETNFNVYAYIDEEEASDSTGHIEKLLENFCDLHYKFPHLIVGQLSEKKTKRQFKDGLTAKLLIQFFNKTSDPQMKKYLKDKQMNAILLTQVQNIQKKKLEFLNLFKKTEENFSLIPDNIQQEIFTWEKEKNYVGDKHDDYNSDDDRKGDKD